MALECSPSDELTKLPLLCVPHEDAAFVLKGFRPNGGFFDWDHLYRPKNDSLLTGTLGGQAVRQARVQLLHRTEQHEPKDENLNGPMLPATPEEQFQAVFFSATGYVPRQALDFSTGEARVVTLSSLQRKRLLTSGEVKVGSPDVTRDFLREFVLAQEVEGLQSSLVDEFLGLVPNTTSAEKRKQELAEVLLGTLIDPLTAQFTGIYHACRSSGMLTSDLPETPRDFIAREIIGYSRRSWMRAIITLEVKLRKRREQQVSVSSNPMKRPSPTLMPKMRPTGRIALMPWGTFSTGSAPA